MPKNNEDTRKDILRRQYNMMKENKYTDFTVITNDGFRFEVHRLCLSRSMYFAVILQSQMMVEVNETREDVDKDTFDVLLQYLYIGEVQNADEHIDKLIVCADKYRMSELVEFYSQSILNKLSVNTAAHYLTLVDKVPTEDLKREIISFIGMNLKDVLESEGWAEASMNFNLMSALIEQMLIGKRVEDIRHGTINTAMDGSKFEVTWTLRMEIEERLRKRRFDQAMRLKPIEFTSFEFFLDLNCKKTSWKLIITPYFLEEAEPVNLYGFKAVIVYLVYTGYFRPPKVLCKWEIEQPERCRGRGKGSKHVECESMDETPVDLTGIIFVADDIVFKINFECTEDVGHTTIRSKAEQVFTEARTRKKNYDTIVIVGDCTFDVHKFVLSEQSQVFEEMFDSIQTAYTLENIRPQVFEALLSFMYVMDDLPSDEFVLEELLLAAHNYRLRDSLVRRCEEFLVENIMPTNVANFLVQAHVAGAEKLKLASLKFIGRNVEAVMASNGWLILQTQPSLVTDIIKTLFNP